MKTVFNSEIKLFSGPRYPYNCYLECSVIIVMTYLRLFCMLSVHSMAVSALTSSPTVLGYSLVPGGAYPFFSSAN